MTVAGPNAQLLAAEVSLRRQRRRNAERLRRLALRCGVAARDAFAEARDRGIGRGEEKEEEGEEGEEEDSDDTMFLAPSRAASLCANLGVRRGGIVNSSSSNIRESRDRDHARLEGFLRLQRSSTMACRRSLIPGEHKYRTRNSGKEGSGMEMSGDGEAGATAVATRWGQRRREEKRERRPMRWASTTAVAVPEVSLRDEPHLALSLSLSF